MSEPPIYWFRGMKIDNLSYPEILSKVREGVGMGCYICFVEASSVALANSDVELMRALNDSYLSLPDGMPLVWYAHLLGGHKMVRTPGPLVFRDFVENHAEYCQFVIGDTPERIRKVIRKAKGRNPELRISGYSPPFRSELSEEDNERILERIRMARPDIIWVALGLAKQAKWMWKIAPRVKRGVMMGVGAALKFYTGEIPWPPVFVQRAGLHWISRIVDAPHRFVVEMVPARIKFLCYFPGELLRARLRRFRQRSER